MQKLSLLSFGSIHSTLVSNMEEGGENILDAIYEEDDVDMVDVEEGELVDHESQQNDVVEEDTNQGNNKQLQEQQKPNGENPRRNAKKRKKGLGLGSEGFDINRFVMQTCRRLKEKKSYMVYTAVGCLGVSALSDILKEVDAIQACGGQKTADGKRHRTGGGILWSIIKVREPNAFKEIMKKAKEFEKQFRQPINVKHTPVQKKEESSQGVPCTFAAGLHGNVPDNSSVASQMQDQHEQSGEEKSILVHEEKRIPVHDRLRIPVTYDDDLLRESVDNDNDNVAASMEKVIIA